MRGPIVSQPERRQSSTASTSLSGIEMLVSGTRQSFAARASVSSADHGGSLCGAHRVASAIVSASACTTRSWSAKVMCGNSGSVSSVREASSVTGSETSGKRSR